MENKFQEGDRVVLKQDKSILRLMAGAVGVVWARYAGNPAAYEVTFTDADGEKLDLTLSEDEVTAPNLLSVTSEAA